MKLAHAIVVAAGVAAPFDGARAQSPAAPPTAAPGVVSGGSGNVSIGNLPAARDGDRTTEGGAVTGTSRDVYINGRPAVTTGDSTNCGGIVVGGGGGVFINGKPAGRTGDLTTGCGSK
ncbi:MAG: PAAR domain-containing protein [Hyphomicrobiaceae bacterium]|nr:PAAR domain-containing protein [Hyphomicrobiaceae bacterium]